MMMRAMASVCKSLVLVALVLVCVLVGSSEAWILTFRPSDHRQPAWKRTRRAQVLLEPNFPRTSSSSSLKAVNGDSEKLRKLKEEISEYEREKRESEQQARDAQLSEAKAKQEYSARYSAVVPILKPDGTIVEELVNFLPRLKCPSGNIQSQPTQPTHSFISTCHVDLPLGLVLGEEEGTGMVLVDQVSTGSNGEAADIRVGDLIRACTGCKVEMEQPLWQLMAGGIGQPKTKRFMFSADGQPLEQVMDAIASNRIDPEGRPVFVVLERLAPV